MDSGQPAPSSLKIVAVLFIFGGVCSAIEVVVSLMHSHININFGLLGLFIGPGLLRFSRGWRTCALVFLWIAMIGIPIIALLFMASQGPLDFKVFGQKVGHISKELGLAIAVIMFLLSFWQYLVLTRPDVRTLFGIGLFLSSIENKDAYREEILSAMSSGDFKMAIDILDNAIKYNPQDATLYRSKALALMFAGRDSEAKACIDQSLSIDQNNQLTQSITEILEDVASGKRLRPKSMKEI